MHKTDLIKAVAAATGLSQKEVAKVLESILANVKKALVKKTKVTLIGFGTFSTKKSPARKGRNPQTGKEIKIAASTKVKFSAGKALKDAVK